MENFKSRLLELLKADLTENELLIRINSIIEFQIEKNYSTYKSLPILDLVTDSFTKKIKGDSTNLLQTGFSKLDLVSGGFYLGELVVIGSRPCMGSNQFMVNLALNLSKRNPVMFFTFDLTPYSLNQRIVTCLSKIPLYKLFENDSESGLKKFNEAQKELKKHHLFLIDSGHDSLVEFENICVEHIVSKGVKVIFVDDLQYMTSAKGANKRSQEIHLISRKLKKIAKEYNVIIIVSSEISRSSEKRGGDKRPFLQDLKNAATLDYLADKVILCYRPEYYGLYTNENAESNENIMELIFAKNNTGRIDTIKLFKDEYFTYFSEKRIENNRFDKAIEMLKSIDDSLVK